MKHDRPRPESPAHRLSYGILGGFLFVFAHIPAYVFADDAGATQTVGGITAYLGVVPAEVVGDYPSGSSEKVMHQSAKHPASGMHVMLALYDAQTHARIADATVTGYVVGLGRSKTERPLEKMVIANTTTYGNFFPLSGAGSYRFHFDIRRPGNTAAVQMEFSYPSTAN